MRKILLGFLLMNYSISGFTNPLSLYELYVSSKNYDATLKGSFANYNASQEETNKSIAAFLPQVRFSAYEGRGVTDNNTPGATIPRRVYDSKNYSLSIRQSIFNLALIADYRQSKEEVERQKSLYDKERLSLAYRVCEEYFTALLSLENLTYNEAQQNAAESQLSLAEIRYKSGFGTLTEINEAKASLDGIKAKKYEWLNSLEYSKRSIEVISGIYISDYLSLDLGKNIFNFFGPHELDFWLNTSQKLSPEILAAFHDLNAIDQEITKNFSGHLPTLDLVASRTKTESDNNITIGSRFETDSIGLQLNVPLYSGGYVAASVRQATAKREQAEEKLLEIQRKVSTDVRKYFNEVNNSKERIDALYEAVKSNELALKGITKGYQAGIRSNVDVLNAIEKLYAAKRDLAKERYNFLLNVILLKQVSGVLEDLDIKNISDLLSYSTHHKNY